MITIQQNKQPYKVYKAEDGSEFATQKKCEEYERKTNGKIKYWVVFHNADCTETGVFQNKTYIKTIWEGFPAQQGNNELEILEDYCYNKFGKRTAWVQGVAPCENWKIREIKKEVFDKPETMTCGGYKTKTEIIVLGVGNRDKVNIISQDSV